jgi:hypothetical protein
MSNLVQRAHVEGSGHFGVGRWIVEGTAVYGPGRRHHVHIAHCGSLVQATSERLEVIIHIHLSHHFGLKESQVASSPRFVVCVPTPY